MVNDLLGCRKLLVGTGSCQELAGLRLTGHEQMLSVQMPLQHSQPLPGEANRPDNQVAIIHDPTFREEQSHEPDRSSIFATWSSSEDFMDWIHECMQQWQAKYTL